MEVSLENPGARWPRARTVAAALATALGTCMLLGAPRLARAHVEAVTNCNDSGAGSLRDAVGSAAPGSTVDLSTLACGTITLTSGAIAVTQGSLTLNGPGEGLLTIDGYFADRVLVHENTGTLRLVGVTVADGKYSSDISPRGGCIASNGNVELLSATVRDCIVEGVDDSYPEGGGVFSNGNFSMLGSRVTGNTVRATGGFLTVAAGGGAFANGSMYLKYGTVSDNRAYAEGEHVSEGGGLVSGTYASIAYSTISGNYAQFFGGIIVEGTAMSAISDSTITGNRAHRVSAVYASAPLTVSNSTIAFNRSDYGNGALFMAAGIELESTIVAGNETLLGPLEDDVHGNAGSVVTGANNLIVTSDIPVPADTMTDCPRLMPLDAYGGPTRTHALRSDSPAIGSGNNALGLEVDQRQADRLFGAAPDIGAVEWNGDAEFAFRSGFEPVCDG
jgi:hypothetical protein